jgi:ATP-dependent Clp protease ATP-binding subunit ClpA
VGFEEGGLLTEAIRKTPHAVLLLDEIEKAHPDIFNTLLQVMDYATLTDNNGRKADFRNVIIIMTSNAGARDIGRVEIGFGERRISRKAVSEAIKKIFSPEFRNRMDAMVTFNGLTRADVISIVKKQLREFQQQLAEKGVTLDATDAAVEWLAEKGYSDDFGARQIARLIQEELKDFFVTEVLFGRLTAGGRVRVDVADDKIDLAILDACIPAH